MNEVERSVIERRVSDFKVSWSYCKVGSVKIEDRIMD